MKVLIIDNHTNYIEKLKKFFTEFEVTVKSYLEISLEDKESADLIILTGGYDHSPVITDPSENQIEINIIKESSKPIIGICYGGQLIAHTFGSSMENLGDKVETIKEITFDKDFLDYKVGDRIKVRESHRYSVTNLGEELELIASSENGEEISKHKQKEIYTLQFHPEIDSDYTDGDELFKKLIKQILK